MKQVAISQRPRTHAATVIDVCDDEDRLGHVPTALNLTRSRPAVRVSGLLTDVASSVLCRSGARSPRVTATLDPAGLPAVNVEGGTTAWIEAGLPTAAR
jgi:rhodanese-related sulfurtransferase